MDRFIAIDAGKSATKVAMFHSGNKEAKTFSFATKISQGDFRDDALEKKTAIAKINGVTYKIGNGATKMAGLETSKNSDIHRNCILAAIAMACAEKEDNKVHAAIGMPVSEWENVAKRVAFKKFIFPEKEYTIEVKTGVERPIQKKTFSIESIHVYPETQGALFIGDTVDSGDAAVIDLGFQNNNCTVWSDFELNHKYSITGNLGGGRLLANIARNLSREFTFCDETTVMNILLKKEEERFLIANKDPDGKIKEKSHQIIMDTMMNYVKDIRRDCDAAEWPIDYMKLYFIGGTSLLLKNEIIKVFGDGIYIPEKPEYANCLGFLRVMCGKILNEKIIMPKYVNNLLDIDENNTPAA